MKIISVMMIFLFDGIQRFLFFDFSKVIDNFTLSVAPFLRFLGFGLLESAGSS